MIDFSTIDYLKTGNPRQAKVYKSIVDNKIFNILSCYSPVLVGTFPIGIDTELSDLDIICECQSKEEFINALIENFQHYMDFSTHITSKNGLETVICRFQIENLKYEIFGNSIPVFQQQAYKHMLVEHRILNEHDEHFKDEIIKLKRQGMKTEPAFALLLGLTGDPYQALLDLQ